MLSLISWSAVAAATAFRPEFIRQSNQRQSKKGGGCCHRTPSRHSRGVPLAPRFQPTVCPNSPYRDHAFACLRELVANYEIKGVFIDMTIKKLSAIRI